MGKIIFSVILIFTTIAAWFTHLFICFTVGKWGFLIAGATFFPIGIIHGVGHWLGWW